MTLPGGLPAKGAPIAVIEAPFDAHITLPGSKSIALRQMAISALCEDGSSLSGIPDCDDVDAMFSCLQRLGVGIVRAKPGGLVVTRPMSRSTDVHLDAHMSGVSARLLLAMAALRAGSTSLDGRPSLRARTNADLLAILSSCGCLVEACPGGLLPARIRGPVVLPTELRVSASLSSQHVSALALIAPFFGLDLHVQGDCVSKPYIDISLHEMRRRGVAATWVAPGACIRIARLRYRGGDYRVEGDATAATYFAALATLHGGRVTCTNLGRNTVQGDYGFFSILQRLGARVVANEDCTLIQGPQRLCGLTDINMSDMPDAALTLMTLAPLLPTATRINGLASLHHKECDRLTCAGRELRRLGVHCIIGEEHIEIQPLGDSLFQVSRAGVEIRTYEDHRMAMAFSILASRLGHCRIDNPEVVAKTYPNYWRDYGRLTGAQRVWAGSV